MYRDFRKLYHSSWGDINGIASSECRFSYSEYRSARPKVNPGVSCKLPATALFESYVAPGVVWKATLSSPGPADPVATSTRIRP
ncbi:hypothetical protein L916_10823 [Phytophthora nicotianae]|uniref:Uncharacterized protein n=1 Tax=Phytophthora nicotianae TaxID=4792 RepID=W2ITF4_PHYNI|nr:hypothetical protein L916_10823 [Phytophthora nicotianae]